MEIGHATEFEKLGQAIARVLGTKKAFKKVVKRKKEKFDVYYSKNKKGKAIRLAVIQKGVYEPNCTHTWVVGVDVKKSTISQVRIVEMSCPHAFPTKRTSFLDQYKGKGQKDKKKLKANIKTMATATGSSNLCTDAVIKSLDIAKIIKGTI